MSVYSTYLTIPATGDVDGEGDGIAVHLSRHVLVRVLAVDVSEGDTYTRAPLTEDEARQLRDALTVWLDGLPL